MAQMPILKTLQALLKSYDELVKAGVGLVLMLSGWVFSLLKARREGSPLLTIELRESALWVTNHGPNAIDIVQASALLRDMSQKPELAKKHWYNLPAPGAIQTRSSAKFAELNGQFESTMAEIWAPYLRQMAQMGWSGESIPMAHLEIYISCGIVGRRKLHAVRVQRLISGSPSRGWYLQYLPYHGDYVPSLRARLGRWSKGAWKALTNPRDALKQRRGREWLREHLDVMSILQALQEKTITEERAERMLTSIASRTGKSVERMIDEHLTSNRNSTEQARERAAVRAESGSES